MWRIKVYKERAWHLLTITGAFASVLGLIVPVLISTDNIEWWMIALGTVFVVTFLVLIMFAFKSETTTRIYQLEDHQGIRDYMFRWIKNGGRVVIWTHDMSWVNDREMSQMLRAKAESRELIICLPEKVDKTDYLEKRGAEVIAYGTWESPATSTRSNLL